MLALSPSDLFKIHAVQTVSKSTASGVVLRPWAQPKRGSRCSHADDASGGLLDD